MVLKIVMMIFICGIFREMLTTFARYYLKLCNRVVYIGIIIATVSITGVTFVLY